MASSTTLRQFHFYLPAFALSAWGVTLFHSCLSGQIRLFLHPLFRPLTFVAGFLLIFFGILYIFFFKPSTKRKKSKNLFYGSLNNGRWILLCLFPFLASAYAPTHLSDGAISARDL